MRVILSQPLGEEVHNDHQAVDYPSLPDAQHLQFIGQHLIENGVHAAFGVTLLHEHFDMLPGDIMTRRGPQLAPVPSEQLDQSRLIDEMFYLYESRLQAYEHERDSPVEGGRPPNQLLHALMQKLIQRRLDSAEASTRINPDVAALMEHCKDSRAKVCAPVTSIVSTAEATN
ncbi:hypothetical protein ANO11243_011340 [Dothideomycetidae sp. 11243]|nr:hypothetical protein ANO11243_011340 [fungal sp. No.11243]